MLVSRGLAVVLADLAKMGFDARWGIVGAHHAGAPHKRDRIWIMAYSDSLRELQPEGGERHQRKRVSNGGEDVAYSNRDNEQLRRGAVQAGRRKSKDGNDGDAGRTQWPAEPDVG